MARRTTQQLKSKDWREKRNTTTKNIKGRSVKQDSSAYYVHKAISELSDRGFAQLEYNYTSENTPALTLLSALNINISNEGKDFSLLTIQTNQSEIDFDPSQSKKVQNEKSDPVDKFPNSNDPFYQLDSAPEIAIQQATEQRSRRQEPDLVNFASNIVELNYSMGKQHLKPFKIADCEKMQIDYMKYSYRTNMPAPSRGKGSPQNIVKYEDDFVSQVEDIAGSPNTMGSKIKRSPTPKGKGSKIKRSPKRKGKGY